jgi:putative flippase GtrA
MQADPLVMLNKPVLKQFLLFAGLGLFGTAGHYTTLISLVELGGVDPVYATTTGFVVGAIINYILNYRITFRSDKKHHEALTKFLLVAAVGAAINSLIMYLGTDWLALHYFLVQIVATGIVLLWNFLLNKLWTFAHRAAIVADTDND